MNNQNNPMNGGGKQRNDPSKNDPTKQDERDNDATRIRPEKEKKEPAQPPPGGDQNPIQTGVIEPDKNQPYKRNPAHKPEPVEEPEKQKGSGINKENNPANPINQENQTNETDDQGNPVVKGYGKGL